MTHTGLDSIAHFAGKSFLVLNWRDVSHPQAGGAEQYIHQISRRWVEAGVDVTWFTGRSEGQSPSEVIDGIFVARGGGPLAVYPKALARLARQRRAFEAVIDCQNGIPFFSPLILENKVPVVQVVHHVHQEQFSTRFSPPMAALGRHLEGNAAKAVYGTRPIATVSPSTRLELRRLGFRGPIDIVPNGSTGVAQRAGARGREPTITVVSRLVPHKRIDILLGQVAVAATAIPSLKVEIVGEGPERPRLQQIAMDLGLNSVVTFHGYQPDQCRNEILSRAWLTVSTSANEGWGCTVIEAAAMGIPCLALRAPGIRDSVIDGRTGWLVSSPKELGRALTKAVNFLSVQEDRDRMSEACQTWASFFNWDRSAELLAGVVFDETSKARAKYPRRLSRSTTATSDISTRACFELPFGADLGTVLRPTDEVAVRDGLVFAIFKGRDEFEASALMRKLGVVKAELRIATQYDLLAGPLNSF